VKQEYLDYVKRFETIGDLIIIISHMIKGPGAIKIMTVETYEEYQKNIQETIDRFKQVKDSMSEMKNPEIIDEEHAKLVGYFSGFIESIEILNSSVNLEKFDPEHYSNGLKLQEDSKVNLMKTIEEIVNKFQND
jgi:hypothetical protein